MADTTVKLFDSQMSGAPTLNGTAGSLLAILDACLVNGFGLKTVDSLVVSGGIATATISTGHAAIKDSVVLLAGATLSGLNGEKKVLSVTTNTVVFDAAGIADQTATGTITLKLAAAGWAKEFSGTNKTAYKSANPSATGCLIRIDDTNAYDVRVVGYESMAGIDTGTGPFPTPTQQSGGLFWAKANNATGTRKWWIVANDRFVYIGLAHNSGYADDYVVIGFGDVVSRKSPDAYKFVVNGYMSSYYTSAPQLQYSSLFLQTTSADATIAIVRSYTQLGGSTLCASEWGGRASTYTSGAGTRQFPNGPDNGLLLEQISLFEGVAQCLRGALPGVLACHQGVGANILNDAYIIGIPQYAGRSFLWKILGSSSVATRGGFVIDITGPWSS